jgi:hypothetical protein
MDFIISEKGAPSYVTAFDTGSLHYIDLWVRQKRRDLSFTVMLRDRLVRQDILKFSYKQNLGKEVKKREHRSIG